MRILVVHNLYQNRGGEDVVREAETRLLRKAGHHVVEYLRYNSDLRGASLVSYLRAGTGTIWSLETRNALRETLRREKPDVTHFHNTFPLISPSAYYACADVGVPVVQTLHNYRLLCPAANLLREQRICVECLGRQIPWPALKYGCYRESRAATTAIAAMLAVHRQMQTWQKMVTIYLALTQFARQKFIAGGLPADRVHVKPNFVEHDPGPKAGPGDFILYVGRLSEEKGIQVLLQALARVRGRIPLKIVGDGPLREQVQRESERHACSVEVLGVRSQKEVTALMQKAYALVAPSLCFENFPLVIAEAAACGLPVIAPRLGAMEELIADQKTGALYEAADADALAAKIDWAWNHPHEMTRMGAAARVEFEVKYTCAAALNHLERAYELAMTPSAFDHNSQFQPRREWRENL